METNSDLASLDEMSILATVIKKSFEAEYKKLSPERKVILDQFLLTNYYDQSIYLLLSASRLSEISVSVFSDVRVRNFFINLTNRCLIFLSVKECSFSNIVSSLTEGLTKNCIPQVNKDFCLIEQNTATNLSIDKEFVENVFSNNPWLVIFFFTIIFFDKFSLFKETIEKKI